jgi:hypothetical protein
MTAPTSLSWCGKDQSLLSWRSAQSKHQHGSYCDAADDNVADKDVKKTMTGTMTMVAIAGVALKALPPLLEAGRNINK